MRGSRPDGFEEIGIYLEVFIAEMLSLVGRLSSVSERKLKVEKVAPLSHSKISPFKRKERGSTYESWLKLRLVSRKFFIYAHA
jgi:hypothetical protein